jgi:hypothetical protein
MLPDEVLLAIFDFFVDEDAFRKKDVEAWQSLVHVCRRWRSVVFGSPHRLNLRLVCGAKAPVRDTLDIWPPLPLVIRGSAHQTKRVDNIVVGLERSDRVCQIDLWGHDRSPLEKFLAAMQRPFPELTDLVIKMLFETVAALPDSFLGGSSPRLRKLHLYGIAFSGLPKLLLSATHLVDLQLCNIPHSGYISPEEMVTAISTLPSLQILCLKFLSFRSRPKQASRHPPPTRSLLPVLDTLRFEGVIKYLDDLVDRIDAPRLNILDVAFFNRNVSDAAQFLEFINRTPALEVLEKAHVTFQFDGAGVKLLSETSGYRELNLEILCEGLDLQLFSLERFCTLCLPPLSKSENLYIYDHMYPQRESPDLPDDIEDTRHHMLWLELLRPFTAVKNLYLSKEVASCIVPVLQELVGGRITGVLPALENIFLEGLQPLGPLQEGIEKFVAARQLSGHPITVSPFLRDRDMMNMRNRNLEFKEW